MARFYGKIGYGVPGELVDGVWSDTIKERDLNGKYLNETVSHDQDDEKVNADMRFSSRISVVADPFIEGHFSDIKYIIDEGGVYWVVTSVELKRPRLVLSTGGVYHGPKAEPSP